MEENKNEVTEETKEIVTDIKSDEVKEEPPVATTSEPVTETKEEPVSETPTKEKKKNNKTAIIIISILVIVLIAALILLLLNPFGKEENKEEKKEEEKIVTEKEYKSEYKILSNSLVDFDLYFLKLENKEENKIYSPLSIKYAIEMLAEGSKGDSKGQIDAIIGDYVAKKYPNNDNMSFANVFFVRDTLKDNIVPEYLNLLTDKYGAEIVYDSFESPKTINDWISSKTFKLINDLVDKVDDKDFFLVNALAIDMKWVNQIHCASGSMENVPCYNTYGYMVTYEHEKLEGEDHEYTRISYPYTSESEFPGIKFNGKENIKAATVLASFNRYDAVKTIGEDKIREEVGAAYDEWKKTEEGQYDSYSSKDEMLEKYIKSLDANYGKAEISTDFMLYVNDNVKVFAKDLQTYDGVTLQYIGIMPTNTDLKTYVDNVKAEDINNLISNLKELKIENFDEGYATIIEGEIPMFNYEYELQLMEDLKKLGITDVFDDSKVDLSGMLKEAEGFSIVEAKHKAKIEFSNEGIRAAAASEFGGMGNAGGGFNYLYEVPTKRINITFDNPYLYLIRDKNTGEVWFVGTVYEPITK